MLRSLLLACSCFAFTWVQAQVDVFAAASLNEVFAELGAAFEAKQSGVSVRLNSAGSAILATQINQGAPADVFVSADLETLLRVVGEGEARALTRSVHHATRGTLLACRFFTLFAG